MILLYEPLSGSWRGSADLLSLRPAWLRAQRRLFIRWGLNAVLRGHKGKGFRMICKLRQKASIPALSFIERANILEVATKGTSLFSGPLVILPWIECFVPTVGFQNVSVINGAASNTICMGFSSRPFPITGSQAQGACEAP